VAEPKDETFRVIDKRLFNEEGELRKDAIEQERRSDEVASRKAAQEASDAAAQGSAKLVPSPGASGALAGTGDGALPVDAAGANATLAPDEPGSRGFQMLVDFLTRNAAAMLGGMADPRTGQAFLDLDGAREMIDMLDALREKTKGNLAKVDDELLVEVIGSLKLTFMEISKAAAEHAKKQAPIKP
jgi:Domain of unknown function (DUF1844)